MSKMSRRGVATTAALLAAGGLAAAGASAATVHREHEINDGRSSANGPVLSGSTWSGVLNTRNDSDWYKLYLGRRTQVSITVTDTAEHGTKPMGIQLLGRADEIHHSGIFYAHGHRTLTRTFGRGTAWIHIGELPGYYVKPPTPYTITVRTSSKLLRRRP